MARLARVVAAGLPHHVTQRGNRRQPVFFADEDYATYRDLLAEGCRRARVAVWTYCLMPNHVHLILVPSDPDGLREAEHEAIRAGERTGRPLGSPAFVARLEKRLKRPLARQKPGPKPKAAED